MVDEFYEEIIWDRQVEETEEPVAEPEETEEPEETDDRYPYEKEILGTWVDNVTEYRETFTFYEDGGYEGGFRIDSIDGDTMLISNDAVMEMPFDHQ